ncbi:hypothetical protein M404DRAFT_1004860 [Pisolithus tinctorius Marx 270]|uniref:SigF-like NTF2-like domain-containing protein n=1 Tax=Pisolithus tinctorius Marx 270 TaxID=870435 RepID=A0A0C3IQF0_PISTI|nr:hypothetical protein M404DRAFT_1004860 [Pisolithus tinctorius Marx 270]
MENPEQDLPRIVHLLTSSKAAVVLHETIKRYYTPDASLRHPLSIVESGPTSRDKVLGVYEWYRVMSPGTVATINEFVYDRENKIAYLDVSQTFKLRLVPSPVRPSRLVTRLKLVEQDKLLYIKDQEDFFHPDDMMKYAFPSLAPIITLFLRSAAIGAWLASKLYLRISMAWLAIFGISNDVQQGHMTEAVSEAQHALTTDDNDERLKGVYYGQW